MAISDRAVYATQPRTLQQQIDDLLKETARPAVDGEVLGLVVPDSNLLRGGRIAAEAYRVLEGRQYDTVIVVSPSHTGPFSRMNICSVDTYRTPLGELTVNDRLRNELCDEDDDIFLGDQGHYHTEGVDVQLPFLQTVLDGFDIVPIVMGEESPDFCRELGHAVGEVMYNRRALVIATVDVLDASDEGLEQLRTLFEAKDVSRLMALLNSETVWLEGRGALLVALIATLHRRADQVRVLRVERPDGDQPGCFSAVLYR